MFSFTAYSYPKSESYKEILTSSAIARLLVYLFLVIFQPFGTGDFQHTYKYLLLFPYSLIFAITFLGSVLFAWVYFEWDFNIWTAIFLHFFMNLYWEIFNVAENVSGNFYGSIFKFISIILIIIFTLYHKKKNKIPLQVTIKRLFIKNKPTHSLILHNFAEC